MVANLQPGAGSPMIAVMLCLFCCFQDATMFHVNVTADNKLEISLEPSDIMDSASVYVVKITGESKNYFFQFEEFNSTLPTPLIFNATYHGLYYVVTLMVISPNSPATPAKSLTVLTKLKQPLPVSNVFIYDYKPSPETGVLFEVQYPEKFNVFTRVNISYWEGSHFRSMLYKDFFKGKTVFNHWLPGTCYSNVTFQLVSEVSFNKSTLVEYSGVGHKPRQHRTVPYPPRNISIQIILINESNVEEISGSNSGEVLIKPDYRTVTENLAETNSSYWSGYNATNNETISQPYWWGNEPILPDDEGFINEIPSEFENPTTISPLAENSPIRAHSLSQFKVSINWLPPKAPSAFDGFTIYIHREGNSTNLFTVDENTHEFVTELKEPGKYKLSMTSFSSSGSCDVRESNIAKALSFYISPSGTWFEELTEKPKRVSVKLLNSTAAVVSWTSSNTNDKESIVSVISQTCNKPKESQRLEKHYCKEVNSSSNIIANLVPGAQYKIVVYFQRAPLIGPPSDAVIFAIEPTGVKDLVLYPLGPSAVVLSWTRPYHSVFRKYIVEMFYFNPVIMTAEWSPYYEIAATVSVTASVRILNLLPAWYYNFRVMMVTWGEPVRRCCDTATVSFITGISRDIMPPAESNGLYASISQPNAFSATQGHADLSPAGQGKSNVSDLTEGYTVLHTATFLMARGGMSILRTAGAMRVSQLALRLDCSSCVIRSVSRSTMTAVIDLPPGDIYNITITAYTERSSNSSRPYLVKLDPVPPKSLFVVNKTQTSVTLLWVEDGVMDYFEVICWCTDSMQKGDENDPVTVVSHVVTISGLQPGRPYNCSVTTISHQAPSSPTYISISTLDVEVNPNVVVISVLAILSILLIGLLLITLLVLRRKHLQMARECGAGTFVNFATLERDGKLPYNWRRSVFTFLTLLPSCLWTDYLLAFYINPWNKNGFKKRKMTNPVQLDDFEGYIKDMAKDTDYKFSLQFEELKMIGLDILHVAADLPANKCKNRYTNILPYDFSRVKLLTTCAENGADYINANYIPGYNTLHEYIATQGPLPETRNDFWKMLLQQKSQVVVMLTQCNEKRRIKCDHYWPFTAEPVSYGDITVEMLSEDEQSDWAYRVFRISFADETQCVKHFNFTAWPDHGVPSSAAADSLLQFVQMVRHKAAKTKCPITVHCSAGVGRTGTFIALDRLMQHIRDHEFVDVLGLVAELRSYRMSMVQTEEQFIFIHHCQVINHVSLYKENGQSSSFASDLFSEWLNVDQQWPMWTYREDQALNLLLCLVDSFCYKLFMLFLRNGPKKRNNKLKTKIHCTRHSLLFKVRCARSI
ncbi:Receptor-type tyrosine- phosphatase O [Pelobates cultripes]|uniref:protein-tyrosine-phosphatase n=1 Tax=Pelobates cultripes TaxID=61616 RepID=A0AAD1W072_PELCU|nr:Receptor-type tyrosine- phosphatase O [Pelobates cultripes]